MPSKTKSSIVVTALVAAALAAPAAQAQPIDTGLTPAAVVPAGVNAGLGPSPAAHQATTPQASPSTGSGFDLGDAAIGGAVTLALVALGMGATQAARHSRHGQAATS